MKTLLEFIEEHNVDIDSKVLSKVVGILDDQWTYLFWLVCSGFRQLSNEIVQSWMGYKLGKNMMVNIYTKLHSEYIDHTDYKQVDKTHELVETHPQVDKCGNRKKFYIVTSKTLITMMLRAQTKTSTRYAEYFYEIRECMIEYYKYQAEELRVEFKQAIQQLVDLPHVREYTLLQSVKYLDLEIEDKYKSGVVYFIQEEDDDDFYKVGFTTHLPTRLEQLQAANRRKLKVYKTVLSVNASVLESIVHRKLDKNLVRGEWYQVGRDTVDRICAEFSQ